MSKLVRSILFLSTLAAASALAPAFAETIKYKADLSSASEVPPNDSGAKGAIEATYDSATGMLSWSGSYSGLSGPAVAAHFHGPAAAGANAPPIVPVDASKSPFEGSAKITADQAKEFADGVVYFNVHTAKNKGGETRGQLTKE
jgi:hypothetical protein